MNRREFVVCGTAAVAGIGVVGCVAAGETQGATVQSVTGPRPYKLIFDARFQQSRAFGGSAAQLGCTIQPINGDVTALWFDDLQPRWAQRKEAIVGMTTVASLLCLEQLAWERWMRVVARIEHRPERDGRVRHRLFLDEFTLQEAHAALIGNEYWAERLAAPLVRRLGAKHYGRPAGTVVWTRHPLRVDPRISLVSWVIAGRSGAGAPENLRHSTSSEVGSI